MSSPIPSERVQAERPTFKRKGRLVFIFLMVLVFIGLAPLATVAWKLIDINREALTTSQQEYQLLLASSIAAELDVHVEGLADQLTRVSQTLGHAIGQSRSHPTGEILEVLEDVADERMVHVRYAYFAGDSVRSISTGAVPADLEPVFASGLEHAVADLSPVSDAFERPVIISEPLLVDSVPVRTVIVMSAPVVSRGKFQGVLSALIDLQCVWESVVSHHRTGHVVYAIDRTGRVLTSTDPAQLAPGIDARASELARRFLSGEGRARETMPFVESSNGEMFHYLGSYETSKQGWGVFVRAGLTDVYRPVQSMVDNTKAWALAALLLAVVAAFAFARTLSNPINRLAETSRAFAAGDFSARVVFRSGNEIGELAFNFNQMASEIEDHIRQLERAAEENRELFLGTIRALAQAIDAKDPYTRGHSVRVNQYAVMLARELGMPESSIHDIHVASLLHDVGKIGINDSILQKPGKLTDDEFEIMKTHTVKGAEIMAPIPKMASVVPGLRSHHEKWSGGGYPDGLSADEIPLMARIIAVADAFDAMTTARPYQRAMSFERAIERLNEIKGSALDARAVEGFNRLFVQGLIAPESEGATGRAEPELPVAATG